MASIGNTTFSFYVTWLTHGQRRYRRVSGVADAPGPTDNDPEATPPPPRFGVLSFPRDLFLQAFRRPPVVQAPSFDLWPVDDCYNVSLYDADRFAGLVVELAVVMAYMESTVAPSDEECEDTHEFCCNCRQASRSYNGIRAGDCVSQRLEEGFGMPPVDVEAICA